MVLRIFGIKEETKYGESLDGKTPDWHKEVTKSSFKLNDEPVQMESTSRMTHRVRAGVIKPSGEVEAYVDLKRVGHLLKAFLDNYKFTAGEEGGPNTHEFWGGESQDLHSFSGWATFDYFQKKIKGLVLNSLKLEVSDSFMTSSEEWIYKTEETEEIDQNTYERREVDGDIPLMFYDVNIELEGAPAPGVCSSFSLEANNNLAVDNTIGLGARWPQKKAAAQKRECKMSLVSSMTPETLAFIRKSEYGEDANSPSECKVYKLPLKVNISVCEQPEYTLTLVFPESFVAVEYEGSGAEEIETTFNLNSLGSGKVTLADGSTKKKTDFYAKLINDVGEISPS